MIRLYVLRPTACLDSTGKSLETLVRSPKQLALLAYLAVATPRGLHRRDTLLGLFWPKSDLHHARASLRQTVKQLRDQLGDVLVSRGREELGLDVHHFWCDAAAFQTLLDEGNAADALELYGQDLLDGFFLTGADEFERWLDAERIRLRRAAAAAAWKLADDTEDPNDGGRWARRAAALTPHDETGLRRLMNYLDERGDPIAALREFERFSKRVHKELGISPGPETRGLADSIRGKSKATAVGPSRRVPMQVSSPATTVKSSPPRWAKHVRSATLVAGISLAVVFTWGMARLFNRESEGLRLGVVTHVTTDEGLELYPSISPDGEEVVYMVGFPGAYDLYVRRVSGGRPILLTGNLPGNHVWPRWSPAGEQIAFVTILDDHRRILHLIPPLGGPPRVLFESGPPGPDQELRNATWSSDGTYLAFVWRWTIYKISLVSGDVTEVTAGAWEPNSLAWNPTGEWIAFVSDNSSYAGSGEPGNIAPSSIWVVSADGGEPRLVVPGESVNQSPGWLPDGRNLLFVSNRDGARDLYIQEIDAAARPVGRPARLTTALDLLTFTVSADGSRLTYDVPAFEANIWTMPIPSVQEAPVSIATAERLTSGHQWIETIRVSSDGKWIGYDSNGKGNQDIYKIPIEGGEPVQLTRGPEDDFAPEWSPDGNEIAFYSFRDGSRDLFVMDANGNRPRRVTSDPGTEAFPTWSPDGLRLAFQFAQVDRDAETGRKSGVFQLRRPDQRGTWGAIEPLVPGDGSIPRWSPDGARIVFHDAPQITLFELATGARSVLLDSINYASNLVWDSYGRVVYTVGMIGDQLGIWELSITESEPRLLVSIPRLRRRWLDVDGHSFFFAQAETREADVWVVNLDHLP